MLETEIKALTKAIKQLTVKLDSIQYLAESQSVSTVSNQTPIVSDEPTELDNDTAVADMFDDSEVIDLDLVRDSLNGLAKAKDKEAVKSLLSDFDVKKVSELAVAAYANVIKKANLKAAA